MREAAIPASCPLAPGIRRAARASSARGRGRAGRRRYTRMRSAPEQQRTLPRRRPTRPASRRQDVSP
ncbi:hypothetical protein DOU07_08660 [Clavibacter michiganensis subsp. michiganensis]|nr:hypothetical protein [Clavibacter michiganensis subsp. michiganensis]MWJ25023.1 hypothetical protein [Clavibacter michiganensis subsp. michiganensis]MWJ37591.1 hypothetical protein [Clavibacter michiganensis subsp. michiganensis]MWJ40917.1 hypothetical protein [Clavibacter michiganensis subsp. michiganensis]MWJ47553.1 hypothetical protein [Clavibacter michiganensis subsp. michiganensis]